MGSAPELVDIMLVNELKHPYGKHIYVLASSWDGAPYWSGAFDTCVSRETFLYTLSTCANKVLAFMSPVT